MWRASAPGRASLSEPFIFVDWHPSRQPRPYRTYASYELDGYVNLAYRLFLPAHALWHRMGLRSLSRLAELNTGKTDHRGQLENGSTRHGAYRLLRDVVR